MKRFPFVVLAVALFAPAAPAAPTPMRTLENAGSVLDGLAANPLRGIPPQLLAEASGVAIFPRVIKVGLVAGLRGGKGVVLAREKDGRWGPPVFASFRGASVGVQAGIESSDVVLVFRSRRSLDRVLEGKVKLALGADAAVAAGPIGREIEAATDARLEAEILCYSRTRGLFAGVSLDGGAINPDPKTNAAFRNGARAEEEKALNALKARLVAMSSIGGPPPVLPGPPAPVVVVPPPLAPLPPPPPPARKRPRWFSSR